MKLSTIFQALKILLAISEQVTELIADSNIPEGEQPEIQNEVDRAVENLGRAKKLIAVPPAKDTAI